MSTERIWNLLSRRIDGEATMDELHELEQLLIASTDESYRIDIVTNYLEKLKNSKEGSEEEITAWHKHTAVMQSLFPSEFDYTDNIQKHAVTKNIHKHLWLKKIIFILAPIIFLSCSLFLMLKNKRSIAISSNSQKTQDSSLVQQANISAPKKTRILLADGTIVWLNGNSHIKYNNDFGKSKRDIVLTGEAFFEVVHNNRVPLVVHARNINIVDKGTAFNVRAYDDDKSVETSLIKGIVEVFTQSDPKRKIVLRPNEKIDIPVLFENDQAGVVLTSTKKGSVRKKSYIINKLQIEPFSNLIPETAWMHDKLVFNSERLSDIAEKMQRWYNVTIEIKDDRLKDLKFTGVFYKENLTQALAALQASYSFQYSIRGTSVSIYINKP
ncbi:MAG: DUF4974 domain-containing protein [Bacteroidetes bacterium]|nr:DUF4974 domain-containing protein [Bacteroidota bacterium]